MKRYSGYTLLEIILAVAVLAFALVPIFSMLSSSGAATREQKAESVAANLAKEKMNWLMVVANATNLSNFESGEQTVDTVFLEGNEFQVSARTRKLLDTEVAVVYPKFDWHDIRSCTGGIEVHDISSAFSTENKKINEVVRHPDAGNFHLMDIFLRVKWKLPNESGFKEKNQLILVSRRAFL
jgi:type II secretory pathway pseudopilin PulG